MSASLPVSHQADDLVVLRHLPACLVGSEEGRIVDRADAVLAHEREDPHLAFLSRRLIRQRIIGQKEALAPRAKSLRSGEDEKQEKDEHDADGQQKPDGPWF